LLLQTLGLGFCLDTNGLIDITTEMIHYVSGETNM